MDLEHEPSAVTLRVARFINRHFRKSELNPSPTIAVPGAGRAVDLLFRLDGAVRRGRG